LLAAKCKIPLFYIILAVTVAAAAFAVVIINV
jgi:hypothetical protein